MKFNYKMLLLTAGLLSGISVARADLLATFATVPVSGCPTCTAIDPSGLEANAVGHELFGGSHPWDVWANARRLSENADEKFNISNSFLSNFHGATVCVI